MTVSKPEKTPLDPQGWRASLELSLQPGLGKTILGPTIRSGPLTVQQPFYPEGNVCHLYLLHPPGGLVGGDCLELDVKLQKKSHAFITTPGATKFYRSSGRTALQKQVFSIDNNAVLEWFPQETILFDQAVAKINTVVDLTDDSTFIGWDILCLGQPAVKKRFESGNLTSSMCIRKNGLPVLMDRLHINSAEDLDAPAGLRGFPVCASFWATGLNKELFQKLQRIIEPKQNMLFGMTHIDDLLVARYIGDSPQQARDIFTLIWERIRPKLTGKDICMPRIWNT